MQIEGFWYYLFNGVFEAATIHHAVAKIFGPLLFGRGWCGYACWTAMVLDFLPYKVPAAPRKRIMFWMFLADNAIYYISGIALALILKDNLGLLQVYLSGHGILKAHELLFPVPHQM